MNDRRTSRLWTILAILGLVAANVLVLILLLTPKGDGKLHVAFLDIGQGDSILITGPTGLQMLIDGGPDRSVLRQLPREMGIFDRSLDLVVETHPDKDHIFGLAEVLKQYRVAHFMEPGIKNDTAPTTALLAAVASEPGLTRALARRGMRIHLGGDAYADILYPDKDVADIKETNDGSIAMRVAYGSTSFMLTGDLPSTGEDHLVMLDAADGALGTPNDELKSDVLKAGHHGSKYSTDTLWLRTVHPSTVVISAGKDNTYGHPNPDTIARVKDEGAKIVSTIDLGTIRFVSDGKTIVEK